MSVKVWNKGHVIQLLLTNNEAVEKAMVALYNRQTADEQSTQETRHSNGVGFSGAHAHLGSYYAKWVLSGRNLTGRHLEKARAMSLKYTDQLLDEIQKRQAQNALAVA